LEADVTIFVGNAGADDPPRREMSVWDPVVRLFHWTVAAGCVLDLFILEDGGSAHKLVGYMVAFALTVRLIWGFVGTRHARFAHFAPSPASLLRYVRAVLRGEGARFIGHNPAGAVMIFALLYVLAGVSVTGWMMSLDVFFGDESIETLHHGFAKAIFVLAFFHVAGTLFESWRHKENLIWSMITGRKRA
jgi:cytochrome b